MTRRHGTTHPATGPPTRPGRRRVALVAATVLLIAVAVGVVGYVTGRAGGDDREAAQSASKRQGRSEGEGRARRMGYSAGYARGQRVGYRQTYRKADRAGYRSALEGREITPTPEPADILLDCPVTGAEPNVANLSVRNMGCAEAVGVIGDFGSISQTFSVRGFACGRISGGDLGGTWRCQEEGKVFRFDFGD